MTLGLSQPSSVRAIRNVVLLGPSGSGKTTLAEQLIAFAMPGVQPGSVDGRDSILDADPDARRQGRSVELTVASIPHAGVLVNLIDTPGYADYLGQVRAGLRAADAALFVVSAIDGIDASTRALWDECEAIHMPRSVVVTHLDDDDSDFDEAIAICHRMLTGGRDVLPLHLPVLADDGSFIGVLDLISNRIHEWSSDQRQEREAEPQHLDMTANARVELIDAIAAEAEDESLLDALLDGQEPGAELLMGDLDRAISRGHFHPVQAFSGANGYGGEFILDLVVRAFPSPAQRAMPLITSAQGESIEPLQADPLGPLCAEVIKTSNDPEQGRVSIVRVFSGSLPTDAQLHIGGHFRNRPDRLDHDLTEHDGDIALAIGTLEHRIDSAIAGSIVKVRELSRAEAGDTISTTVRPLLVEPWLMPTANLPFGIRPAYISDEQRLRGALERLIAEDPSLMLTESEGQLILWCLGEAHADLAIARLRTRSGIEVIAEEIRSSMREGFNGPADGVGSVEHGGEVQVRCAIQIAPLQSGSGIQIVSEVVDAPHALLAAAERGIRRQLAHGALAGYPTTDARVTILELATLGVEHDEHACASAGSSAVLAAEASAGKHLMEALEEVIVIAPAEFADAIRDDLKAKRGKVLSTLEHVDGHVTITATAPAAELSRFAIDFRALAHGAGSFQRAPAGFARVPKRSGIRLLPLAD